MKKKRRSFDYDLIVGFGKNIEPNTECLKLYEDIPALRGVFVSDSLTRDEADYIRALVYCGANGLWYVEPARYANFYRQKTLRKLAKVFNVRSFIKRFAESPQLISLLDSTLFYRKTPLEISVDAALFLLRCFSKVVLPAAVVDTVLPLVKVVFHISSPWRPAKILVQRRTRIVNRDPGVRFGQ